MHPTCCFYLTQKLFKAISCKNSFVFVPKPTVSPSCSVNNPPPWAASTIHVETKGPAPVMSSAVLAEGRHWSSRGSTRWRTHGLHRLHKWVTNVAMATTTALTDPMWSLSASSSSNQPIFRGELLVSGRIALTRHEITFLSSSSWIETFCSLFLVGGTLYIRMKYHLITSNHHELLVHHLHQLPIPSYFMICCSSLLSAKMKNPKKSPKQKNKKKANNDLSMERRPRKEIGYMGR